jgi:hypothetical protein
MKTELTYKQIDELSRALLILGTLNFKGAPLDFLISISSNQVALEDHSKVYQETSDKVAKRYAEKGEDGKPLVKQMQIQISDENYEKFSDEMTALLEKKVTVELEPFAKSYFMDNEGVSVDGVTANIIKSLTPILEL